MTVHNHIVFILSLSVLLLCAAAQTCNPGNFLSGGNCIKCPKQRISMIADATECIRCPDGKIPNNARTICVSCPAGRFFMVGSLTPCRRCPIDTFSDKPESLSCTPCPEGKISPLESRAVNQCITCEPGRVVFRSVSTKQLRCVPCGPGKSTSTENAGECLPCPKGSFRRVSGSRGYLGSKKFRMVLPDGVSRQLPSAFDGRCRMCSPGTFGDEQGAEVCKKCPVGQYQNEMGTQSCKTCPDGSGASKAGLPECKSTCKAGSPGCLSCRPGFGVAAGSTTCAPCPNGTISTFRSSTECYPCPQGGSMPNAKRSMCVCPDGNKVGKTGLC